MASPDHSFVTSFCALKITVSQWHSGSVWFGFVRFALLLAVVLCWIDNFLQGRCGQCPPGSSVMSDLCFSLFCFGSWVLLGLFCLITKPNSNTIHPRKTQLFYTCPKSKMCPVSDVRSHTRLLCVTRRKQHRPGIAPNDNTTHVPTACANRMKQCSPNETIAYSNPTPPRKRQNNPTNGHTPRRMKPTHTHLTYTRTRPHVPSHQAGDHPVPAHTERHNQSKVQTKRQPRLPPRTVSSQGQRHRLQEWHPVAD